MNETIPEELKPNGDRIGDIIEEQTPPIFENTDYVKPEDVFNKGLALLAVARRSGPHGDFLTFKARIDPGNQLISFSTGSKVIIDRAAMILKHYDQVMGKDGNALDFKRPVFCQLVRLKGKDGQKYYDFADF